MSCIFMIAGSNDAMCGTTTGCRVSARLAVCLCGYRKGAGVWHFNIQLLLSHCRSLDLPVLPSIIMTS